MTWQECCHLVTETEWDHTDLKLVDTYPPSTGGGSLYPVQPSHQPQLTPINHIHRDHGQPTPSNHDYRHPTPSNHDYRHPTLINHDHGHSTPMNHDYRQPTPINHDYRQLAFTSHDHGQPIPYSHPHHTWQPPLAAAPTRHPDQAFPYPALMANMYGDARPLRFPIEIRMWPSLVMILLRVSILPF